ncbi:MAG TPA: DUF6183 family protein [Labilithrix sp.]|nr:DUF6183 family protein [Labilithrix sp.]
MANPSDEVSPQAILRLLGEDEGETRACEAVEAWAKKGQWKELVDLARALEVAADRNGTSKLEAFELVVDHLEDQLALGAGDDAVDALFALSLDERERSVSVPRPRSLRLRAFASRLGYGQGAPGFLAALERHSGQAAHHELLACWMHEVVLRGTSLATDPRAGRLQESLVRERHPLGDLPLALVATEREAPSYMPLYGDKGLGRAFEALASGTMSMRTIPPPADGAPVEAKPVEDEGVRERLVSAVRPWSEGKSGKIEAKVFELSPKVEAPTLGGWLLRILPLASTARASRLDVSRTGADGVFGPLFSAASNGGAYSSGLGGAYGRLAAWTSLGALVGAPEGADVLTIDKLATTSAFLTFRAGGPWFYDVAWDLGALALRPDGRTVAVLAATDTE